MSIATFDWAIAAHQPNSDQGKYVLGLANQGIGYHIINKDRLKTDYVIVAFKFAANKPLPQHLQYATKEQSSKLDLLDIKRRSPKG